MSALEILDLLDGMRPAWQAHGACRGAGNTSWFPGKGTSTNRPKRVCADCPVKQECLDYALEHHIVHGIWGGTSEQERRLMRRQRRAAG